MLYPSVQQSLDVGLFVQAASGTSELEADACRFTLDGAGAGSPFGPYRT